MFFVFIFIGWQEWRFIYDDAIDGVDWLLLHVCHSIGLGSMGCATVWSHNGHASFIQGSGRGSHWVDIGASNCSVSSILGRLILLRCHRVVHHGRWVLTWNHTRSAWASEVQRLSLSVSLGRHASPVLNVLVINFIAGRASWGNSSLTNEGWWATNLTRL